MHRIKTGDGRDVNSHPDWITPPENWGGTELYFFAVTEVNLRAAVADACLELAAEGHWAVWFNGVLLQTGQDRSPASTLYMDRIPLPRIEASGRCWLSLALHWNGQRNYQGQPVRPGFSARVVNDHGDEIPVSPWRLRRAEEFECRGWFYTFQRGYSEFQDLGKWDAEWWRGEGDGWHAARVSSWQEVFPKRELTRRKASVTLRKGPHGHIIARGCVPRFPEAENLPPGQAMQNEPHLPAPAGVFRDGPKGDIVIMPGAHCRDVFLLNDLRQQGCGHLRIDLTAECGLLDVATNEGRDGDRLFTAVNREGLAADRQYNFADRFRLRKGRQTASILLHRRGGRFVQLVLRALRGPTMIHCVEVLETFRPMELEGAFVTSDKTLQAIWDLCARTLRACSADVIVDPWREQANWTGLDLWCGNRFNLWSAGDYELSAQSLRVAADSAGPDGFIPAVAPAVRSPIIPSFCLHWVQAVGDYWMATGDEEMIRRLWPAVQRNLAAINRWRRADGLLSIDLDGKLPLQPRRFDEVGSLLNDNEGRVWPFYDWVDGEKGTLSWLGGPTSLLNFLYADALNVTAILAAHCEDKPSARAYAARAAAVRETARRVYWNAREQAFETLPKHGEFDFTQHAQAFALLYGDLSRQQKQAAAEALANPPVVGWLATNAAYQTFRLYALVEGGRPDAALDQLKEIYGKFVNAGYLTGPEVLAGKSLNPSYSLCHPWSAAALYFAPRYLFGVHPLSPGWRQFAIEPIDAVGVSAIGRVPTPFGPIYLEREEKRGRVVVRVRHPATLRPVISTTKARVIVDINVQKIGCAVQVAPPPVAQ